MLPYPTLLYPTLLYWPHPLLSYAMPCRTVLYLELPENGGCVFLSIASLASIRTPRTRQEIEKYLLNEMKGCHVLSCTQARTHTYPCPDSSPSSRGPPGVSWEHQDRQALEQSRAPAIPAGGWGCMEWMRMPRAILISQEPGRLTFVASKISSKSIGSFLFCKHKAWLMSMEWAMGQWHETVNQVGPSHTYRGRHCKPFFKIFKRTAVLKA